MKTTSKTSKWAITIIAAITATLAPAHSADVETTINFKGTVRNNLNRQTIQGSFEGEGEFDPFDIDGKINGTLRTRTGQRPSRANVYGAYPVVIYARARRGEVTVSDSFNAIAVLRRGSLVIRGHGRILLNRPVLPAVPGTQVLRGSGTMNYNY